MESLAYSFDTLALEGSHELALCLLISLLLLRLSLKKCGFVCCTFNHTLRIPYYHPRYTSQWYWTGMVTLLRLIIILYYYCGWPSCFWHGLLDNLTNLFSHIHGYSILLFSLPYDYYYLNKTNNSAARINKKVFI